MGHKTVIDGAVPEGTTRLISFALENEFGVPIGSSDLDSLQFSLCNPSEDIINERENVGILNTNGGTLDTLGNGTLLLTPADTALESQSRRKEWRVARFRWEYNNGRVGFEEVWFEVVNVKHVP